MHPTWGNHGICSSGCHFTISLTCEKGQRVWPRTISCQISDVHYKATVVGGHHLFGRNQSS